MWSQCLKDLALLQNKSTSLEHILVTETAISCSRSLTTIRLWERYHKMQFIYSGMRSNGNSRSMIHSKCNWNEQTSALIKVCKTSS